LKELNVRDGTSIPVRGHSAERAHEPSLHHCARVGGANVQMAPLPPDVDPHAIGSGAR
jgi:hypothetical protein